MEKNKIFIQKDFKPCEKVWKRDIGFNIKAISDPEIKGDKYFDGAYRSIDYIEYKTGIKIDPIFKGIQKEQIYTTIWPRSSLSKYNLMLANSIGLIDPDYRNEITVRFKYIYQPEDLIFNESLNIFLVKPNLNKIYRIGDQIAQLVFMKEVDVEFEFVPFLAETGRGGFGSTGV